MIRKYLTTGGQLRPREKKDGQGSRLRKWQHALRSKSQPPGRDSIRAAARLRSAAANAAAAARLGKKFRASSVGELPSDKNVCRRSRSSVTTQQLKMAFTISRGSAEASE